MPLDGSYEWEETPERVVVRIPLRGADRRGIDVFAAPRFVKVNFAPYLVQLDLKNTIDETKCSAKLHGVELQLTLVKETPGLWGELVVEGLSKSEVQARRKEEIQRKRERDEERRKRAGERAAEDERLAVRKQMAIDDAERRHVEELKEEEKAQAESEVYAQLASVERDAARGESAEQGTGRGALKRRVSWADEEGLALTESRTTEQADTPAAVDKDEPSNGAPTAAAVTQRSDALVGVNDRGPYGEGPGSSDSDVDSDSGGSEQDGAGDAVEPDPSVVTVREEEEEEEEEEPAYVPPPRQGSSIKIGFTPRLFPTPMRESKREEEDNWIARNRRFLKYNPNARDVGERDPVWLKGKGDEFYAACDFRSAINAYTAALEADALLAPALSNRAACYLRVGEASSCLEDCNAILALLPKLAEAEGQSEVAVKKRTRLHQRALMRRGAAYMLLHDYTSALTGFRDARDAGAEGMEGDIEHAAEMLDCFERKQGADLKQREGDLEQAERGYNAALEVQPRYLACIANRSACRMLRRDWRGAVADCTAALALLRRTEEGVAAAEEERPVGPVPGPKDPKRRLMKLKTLLRRAQALEQLGGPSAAAKDLTLAAKLDPDNAELAVRARAAEEAAGASGGGGEQGQ